MSGSLCCSQPAPFSSCRLLNPNLPITQPKQVQSPPKKGNHDWLQVMVGRELQDLEYAQGFYQCNLKVHGLCASLVYFYFIVAVGYYSSQFGKLYEEAEDSFFHLSGELLSMLLSKPFLGGIGNDFRRDVHCENMSRVHPQLG